MNTDNLFDHVSKQRGRFQSITRTEEPRRETTAPVTGA